MAKLPGDYVAGLVDGEGHFGLIYYKEIKKSRSGKDYHWEGWRWCVPFVINLHAHDREILEQVRETLGCGKIYRAKGRSLAMYRVDEFKSMVDKVIPFFEKHPLRAKKKLDFELWKKAVKILQVIKRRSGGRGQKVKILPDEQKELERIYFKLKELHGWRANPQNP